MKKFDFDYSQRNANDSFTEEEFKVAEVLIKLAKKLGFSDSHLFIRPLSKFFDREAPGIWLAADDGIWQQVFGTYNLEKLCEKMEAKLHSMTKLYIYCEPYDPGTITIYMD